MGGGRNCWDFMKCGYGPGGSKARRTGICKAALENRLDGIHGGHHGGRTCWIVQDTNCANDGNENFAQKYVSCLECDFYNQVKRQEGAAFVDTDFLLRLLR